MPSVELSVVGISHRVTDATMRKIARDLQNGPMKCSLVREPENKHDENAIKVVIKERPYRGLHLGYIARKVAREYAPAMDAGKMVNPKVWLVDLEEGSGTLLLRFKLAPRRK